jgi:cytochrome c-type biogenesis protein CcmH
MSKNFQACVCTLCLALILLLVAPVFAQTTVTYDDVVRVAERMYCPICENEPLDECRNATCLEWKDEIQRRLEAGQTDTEIINYFVATYGQHVMGVPQDPLLRSIAFAAPILGTLLALVIGWLTFRRWRTHAPLQPHEALSLSAQAPAADYRARLERDLTN